MLASTEMANPAHSLAALLRDRAASEPDALAVMVQNGDALSFRAWEARSNAVARGLHDRQVGVGERVVLWFDRGHWTDFAVGCAGVLKAGAVAVPLSSERSEVEVARIAADCAARGVVTGDGLGAGHTLSAAAGWINPLDDLEGGYQDGSLAVLPDEQGDVEITYRSGPLCRPQPTGRSGREIVSTLAAWDAALPAPLPAAPALLLAFSIGSGFATEALWFPLVGSGRSITVLVQFDPSLFCTVTGERKITHWGLQPRLLELLLDCGALLRHDHSSLRQVVVSGGPTAPSLASRLGAMLPEVSLLDDADEPIGRMARPASSAPPVTVEAGSGTGEIVAAICERVVGHRPDGGNGDLAWAELGSSAVSEVLDLLEDAFGVRLELSALLASPTATAVAAAVEARRQAAGDPEPATERTEQTAPVAFSQEGMLWQENFVPGSQNLPPLVRRYRGPLQVAALQRALEEIVRRHEPLRSTFEMRHGRPIQVVAPAQPLLLEIDDLAHLSPGDQEAAVAVHLSAAGRPFDLVTGPLFEPHLFRLGLEDHILALRVHHSIYDDWSVGVFRSELSALYTAFSRAEPAPLPELPVGFADFARAQRRRLAGPAGAKELAWWKEHLAGAPLCLQLPIDDPNLPEGAPSPSAAPVSLELGPELAARLRNLARQQRSTLFITVLAAFEVLLHRLTGQPELVLATVVANRNRTELEGMIGCFTKKILLRLDAAEDPSFTDLLKRVRARVLDALMHQDLPFETVLQQALGRPAAAHGLVPHVAVMFQGVTPQSEELALPGITTSGYDTSSSTTRVHFSAGSDQGEESPVAWGSGLYNGTFLILSVVEGDETLALSARGAFHRPSVERLLADFRALLTDIVTDPSNPVSGFGLPPAEQALGRVHHSGETAELISAGRSALQVFRSRALRSPSRVAVTTAGKEITTGELVAQVDALAERLRATGVGPGVLVGICLPASVSCVVAVLAVWEAGAAYVGLDPDDPEGRLTAVAEDAAIRIVLTRRALGPTSLTERSQIIDIDDPSSERMIGALGLDTGQDDPGAQESPPIAAVFYGRSSSSLRPGVVIGHGAVAGLLAGLTGEVYGSAENTGSARHRVWLSAGPASDGFLRQVVALLAGHVLRVPAEDGVEAPSAAEVVALVGNGDVDVVDCSPAEATALMESGIEAALSARPPGTPTPTLVVATEGALDRPLQRSLARLVGARTFLLFGPPECCYAATVLPLGAAGARPTIGRPLAGATTSIFDDDGRPAPMRGIGELHVGGATLARGYLNEPERTEERFGSIGQNSWAEGDSGSRLYRTGWLARFLPDGTIELVGLASELLIWRGYRLDRSKMEGALRRGPGVQGADVFLSEDEVGAPMVVASVATMATVEPPSAADLRRALWQDIPGYAWPARLELMGRRSPPERSSTPYGNWLSGLWGDSLGRESAVDDELYWHRFSFIDVVLRSGEAGMAIRPADVMRHRTIAALATALAAARSVNADRAIGSRGRVP